MNTEEYIRDPRFEVMLVSVKSKCHGTKWFSGTMQKTKTWLETFELHKHAVLAHHMAFDGLVLAHHFGIYPAMYLDTRLMAQAVIKPYTGSASLAACLKHVGAQLEIGKKGDEVFKMIGRPRASLSHAELQAYALYCCNDTDTTYSLFTYLLDGYPREELRIIDLTLRMFLQPVLELDTILLATHLAEVQAKKEAALQKVLSTVSKDDLMSNQKFGEILKRLNVEPPMKTSLTTGKPTYAFAKNDIEWKTFAEEYEDDPVVGPILLARLSSKSTLEETRTQRLLDMGNRAWSLRVPLLYYAAHTGRYGGTEGINLQNLPQPHKSKIRFGLRAPTGHVVVGADLSQIEARITAVLAGQQNLVAAFREGRDVYSEFGSRLYGRVISRSDKRERFLAKTAVLGLQYGMGAAKFVATTRAMGDIKVALDESQRTVDTYRAAYPAIPRLWRALDDMIGLMVCGDATMKMPPVRFGHEFCELPSGMKLLYPQLEIGPDGPQYLFGRQVRNLWGGKLLENIVQALARTVIMEHMLTIQRELGCRPCLQVHDELDYVVRLDQVDMFEAAVRPIMIAPPTWMPELPLDVEIHHGKTFGDVK